MPFSDKVDEVFEELENYAKRRNPLRPLFSRIGPYLVASTGLAALMVWGGLLIRNYLVAWTGVAILAAVVLFQVYEAVREIGNPGVTYAGWARSSAKSQTWTLERLHALDPLALAEAEAFLAHRIAAAEENVTFLMGPLRTLGLTGSLSAFVALGTALKHWIDPEGKNDLFVGAVSAIVLGLLLGAERAETGLVQLRINRDLVTRAIALQQTGRPLP